VIALARNLNVRGSRVLTDLTTVLITGLRQTPAWNVRTFALLGSTHRDSPFLK